MLSLPVLKTLLIQNMCVVSTDHFMV
jgi:hypothetical protein